MNNVISGVVINVKLSIRWANVTLTVVIRLIMLLLHDTQ